MADVSGDAIPYGTDRAFGILRILLFLLTLAFYCVHREHSLSSGFFAGVTFGLKLYGGPFLLYFAATISGIGRPWRE
jgi:hypothetical protein